MANKIVRLDVMSGNRDNSQVKIAKYYEDDVTAAVENGTIVGIGGLLAGEREIHKVTPVESTDVYVGIVTTPEVIYDQRGVGDGDLGNFINAKDDVIRVHVLHEGDIFSIANVASTADLDAGAKLIAKHIQTEVVGRYTYQVYEVQALAE